MQSARPTKPCGWSLKTPSSASPAQILGQLGRVAEAVKEAGQAADDAEQRPHIKAQGAMPDGRHGGLRHQPDYKKAIEYRAQAIRTAAALTSNPHPAIRVPAKEVLIDANLARRATSPGATGSKRGKQRRSGSKAPRNPPTIWPAMRRNGRTSLPRG